MGGNQKHIMTSPPSKNLPFRWYDPVLLRVLPPLGGLIIKLLMLSCRVIKVEGRDTQEEALSRTGGRGIYVTWHQRMSYLFHYLGSRHAVVMISQSRDGEYVARMARRLGFKDVRGSSTRGSFQALRAITEKLKEGVSGGMLADGPLGPARVAKPGSVFMARSAQIPLLPITWGADRCWVFNSWDRYMVPKPFARIVLYHAEPIWVPRSAKGEELEAYRVLLEERLNRGARWCDEHFGQERPWRKVTGEGVPDVGPI